MKLTLLNSSIPNAVTWSNTTIFPQKTERTFYSVEVKCGRVSLAKTHKGVTANKRHYIPVHDVNCKYLVPSKNVIDELVGSKFGTT